MPVMPLPIAHGTYESESLPLSAQECVNWYPHVPDVPSLADAVLFGTPGIYQVATAGGSIGNANRGGHRMEGKPYFVQGTSLFRLNADHSFDNLGTIEGVGRVSMDDNGTQLMILSPSGSGYIFTEGPDTLTTITDPGFTDNGAPQHVVFIDSFFCCTTDEKKFIVSSLNDGLTWNALDFGSAESSPDGVVTPIVYKNQLFICGERTIEAFQNIGGADFPFQRTGLFLDEGVTAPFSVISASETFMFVGAGDNETPAIWALAGNSTKKASTQAIDQVLSRLSNSELENIYAWSYSQAGHYFVGFSFPTTCFVFDTTTGRWHERKTRFEGADNSVTTVASRGSSYLSAYGNIYVSDNIDGRVGVLDLDTYTEYTAQMARTASTQPFQNNMKPFFVPMLELTVESGVGLSVGTGSETDPVIRLQVSRDGGKNYSDYRSRPIGKIGEYKRRAIWRRNGRSARFDVYRFTLTDPIKPVVLQLTADIRAVA